MNLNTSNLLSDFLSLILRTWEGLEWERRGVFNGLSEIKKEFHVRSRGIASSCAPHLWGEKSRNKHLRILIA